VGARARRKKQAHEVGVSGPAGGHDRRAGRRPGPPAPRLRLPLVEPVYRELVGMAPKVLECAGPLAGETWFAGLWGDVADGVPHPDVLLPMMLDLADLLEAAASDPASDEASAAARITMLWAMAAMPPTGSLSDALGEAAEEVAAAADRARSRRPGLALPGWVDLLGSAVIEGCAWFLGDPFGETVHLVCRCAYGGGVDAHGFWVTLDRTHRWAPLQVRMLEGAKVDPFLESFTQESPRRCSPPRPLEVAVASRLVRRCLAAGTDGEAQRLTSWPELDPESVTVLPLLARRAAGAADDGGAFLLGDPEADVPAALARRWPPARRAELVEDFLAARGGDLVDVPAAAQLAARLVDLSIGVLGWPPDRIGPRSARTMVVEVLPQALVLPEALVPDLERVVPAWLWWLAGRAGAPGWPAGLPAADRAVLAARIELVADAVGPTYRDRRINVLFPYVADVGRAHGGGLVDVSPVLDRRALAVPLPGDRGDFAIDLPVRAHGLASGEHDADDLDAAHPAHRGLLEGVRARQGGCGPAVTDARIGVVHQVWADDPPEVWQVAQRLRDAGLDRDAVIERLARVWRRQAPLGDALRTGQVAPGEALAGYRAALATLDPSR
jgi:hypothetical protein